MSRKRTRSSFVVSSIKPKEDDTLTNNNNNNNNNEDKELDNPPPLDSDNSLPSLPSSLSSSSAPSPNRPTHRGRHRHSAIKTEVGVKQEHEDKQEEEDGGDNNNNNNSLSLSLSSKGGGLSSKRVKRETTTSSQQVGIGRSSLRKRVKQEISSLTTPTPTQTASLSSKESEDSTNSDNSDSDHQVKQESKREKKHTPRRRGVKVENNNNNTIDTSGEQDNNWASTNKSSSNNSEWASVGKDKKNDKKKMRATRPGQWVYEPVASTVNRINSMTIIPPRPLLPQALKLVLALRSVTGMRTLLPYARPLAEFKPGLTIRVHNKMQSGYDYVLSAPPGKEFNLGFEPVYTPGEMLKLGVFEGHYLNDCILEFPREWYEAALDSDKLRPGGPDISINAFESKSRQPLAEWKRKGWITPSSHDNRGWFQWYCRYWIGRRCDDDARQIGRWRAFRRHEAQIRQNCTPGDITSRRRQRQGLLQWSYNGYI